MAGPAQVVWETMAEAVPWRGLQNVQIVCAVGLREDRLALDHGPALAADGSSKFDEFMQQLCNDCWKENPGDRPSFAQLSDRFTRYMQEKLSS